ncbi:Chaperone protein DnaJ [subsurface metagenome]
MKAVRRAYLKLASQYHPDKNPSPQARQQFIKITQAYNFIVKGGDLARYLALCDVVPLKQKYAESLRNIKITKALTGLDVIVNPKSLNEALSQLKWVHMPKEEWNRQIKLVMALQIRCPGCKWREGCDTATGFSEVEDIYKQMLEESRRRVFGSLRRNI